MSANDDLDIETLSTRSVYENRWMRAREDAVRRRDGSEGIYGVVEKPDFVVIAPVEEDGRVHLVQQYRYPVAGRPAVPVWTRTGRSSPDPSQTRSTGSPAGLLWFSIRYRMLVREAR